MLSGFESNPNLELAFVMIVVPMVLNALMFWITDCFLKFTKTPKEDEKILLSLEFESALIES